MKIKELKTEIKAKAKEIRKMKSERKSSPHGYVSGLELERYHVRHMHVAYCLLRGRTMEEIENKPKTEPSEFWLKFYMEDIKDEDVCASA